MITAYLTAIFGEEDDLVKADDLGLHPDPSLVYKSLLLFLAELQRLSFWYVFVLHAHTFSPQLLWFSSLLEIPSP